MTVIEYHQQEEQQQQQEQQLPSRIYHVTDGLKSPFTRKGYGLTFNNFLNFINHTRNSSTSSGKNKNQSQNQQQEQQEQHGQELRSLLDYKPSVIESKIIDYIEYLKIRKLAYSTILGYCAAIFHFFEINDVNLNVRKIKRFLPQDESENISNDRPYSVNEIERILTKCDVRSRVAILLMTSTGMRIGGLRELRYGDIKKIDEFGLYMIWVYNRSRKDRYYTFCSPECAIAIDAYLDYRRSFGEELKDKSPLIREQFNIDNPFTVKAPRFLSPRMISFLFEDVLKRSDANKIKAGNNKRDVMTSHGYRKFFINQCIKAGLTELTWKPLVGHKLQKTNASYIRTSEEDRLAEYVKAIPHLTIDQSQRLQKEVQRLEDEQSHEITELRQEVERYRRFSEEGYTVVSDFKVKLKNMRSDNVRLLKSVIGLYAQAEKEKRQVYPSELEKILIDLG